MKLRRMGGRVEFGICSYDLVYRSLEDRACIETLGGQFTNWFTEFQSCFVNEGFRTQEVTQPLFLGAWLAPLGARGLQNAPLMRTSDRVL